MRKFKLSNLGTMALINPFHVLMVMPGSSKNTTYVQLPHRPEPFLVDATPDDFEDWLNLYLPTSRGGDDDEDDETGFEEKLGDSGGGGTTDMAARGRPGEDLKARPGSPAATDPRTPGPEQRFGDQPTHYTEPPTEPAIANKPGDKPGDPVPGGQVGLKTGETKPLETPGTSTKSAGSGAADSGHKGDVKSASQLTDALKKSAADDASSKR
jgi:hypothetical protein